MKQKRTKARSTSATFLARRLTDSFTTRGSFENKFVTFMKFLLVDFLHVRSKQAHDSPQTPCSPRISGLLFLLDVTMWGLQSDLFVEQMWILCDCAHEDEDSFELDVTWGLPEMDRSDACSLLGDHCSCVTQGGRDTSRARADQRQSGRTISEAYYLTGSFDGSMLATLMSPIPAVRGEGDIVLCDG